MAATSIRMPSAAALSRMIIDVDAIEEYAKHAKELARLPPNFSIINRELDKNGCYRY